jgi:hypothetical protein
LTRARHLSTASLLALARRPARRVAAWEAAHLETCAPCAEEARLFQSLASCLREPVTEPPAGVVARAWALVEPRAPRRVDRSRYGVARLLFDSHAGLVAAGVRAPTASRHQHWRAQDADVDVRLEGPGLGAEAALVGQILPRGTGIRPPAQGTVWLIEAGRRPRWSLLGPSGEFTLPAPRGRRWALWLEWGRLRLRLESP